LPARAPRVVRDRLRGLARRGRARPAAAGREPVTGCASRHRGRVVAVSLLGVASDRREPKLLDPLSVVAFGPVPAYPAAGDCAERMPGRGMDERQIDVAEQQEEGDVHQPVVHDERVLKPEGVVALPVPENEYGY